MEKIFYEKWKKKKFSLRIFHCGFFIAEFSLRIFRQVEEARSIAELWALSKDLIVYMY